jgi:cytochrome c oxidase subunit 2
VLILITFITIYIITSVIRAKVFNKFIIEGQEIETIWTLLPAVLLLFIAFPSIKTLYLIEDTKNPSITVKVRGHQWY